VKIPGIWRDLALFVTTLPALLAGFGLRAGGYGELASLVWNASALLAAGLLLIETLVRLLRKQIGVDLIALLAIGAAIAFDQALVASLIAVMLATQLYPQLARRIPGDDPLAPLSHTHREIFRLAQLLNRMSADLPTDAEPSPLKEIQRLLLRLETLLSLHFAQEGELYQSLDRR
jgi:hypothetical protein